MYFAHATSPSLSASFCASNSKYSLSTSPVPNKSTKYHILVNRLQSYCSLYIPRQDIRTYRNGTANNITSYQHPLVFQALNKNQKQGLISTADLLTGCAFNGYTGISIFSYSLLGVVCSPYVTLFSVCSCAGITYMTMEPS
jgi:hypothetical protein